MAAMTTPMLPQPTQGDVLELILADHGTFEDLLRECRRTDRDRAAARATLAELLVAHAEAEESEVYPTLRAKRAIGAEKEEHGEKEHAEILEALLAFLDAKGTGTKKYEEALEALAKVVSHHSSEEELSILNPARDDVSVAVRHELGKSWLKKRNALLAKGCASRTQVSALLGKAVADKVLPPAKVRAEADAIKEAAKTKAEKLEEEATS
jgi:hemerythrin superfamily protein